MLDPPGMAALSAPSIRPKIAQEEKL